MSEPRRLLDDEHATPLSRALLRSVEGDGLDAPRAAAVARALGLSGAASAAMGAPADAPASPKVVSPASPAKWGVVTVIAGAVVATAVLFGRGDERVASSPSPDATATVASVPPSEPTVPSASAAAPSPSPSVAVTPEVVSVALLPEAPPERGAPRARANAPSTASAANTPSTASTAAGADDLSAEIRALEHVRASLAAHRTAEARDGLTRYERSFPTKLLGKEARVLEIETLFAEGRRSEGEARARAFLATSAKSPYAARVRSLLTSAGTR